MIDRSESCVRFWTAPGCIVLGKETKAAEEALLKLRDDTCGNVRIVATEALSVLGKKGIVINPPEGCNTQTALHARNAADALKRADQQGNRQ